jgi:hypothetical protein
MEMRQLWRAAVAVGMLWLLAACAGTTEVVESQNKARSPSQARIYFLRNKGVVPTLAAPDVKINGQKVGSIATGTYFSVDRPPGSYTFGVMGGLDIDGFETTVQLSAGQTYYFEIGPKTNGSPGQNLLVPALAGTAGTPTAGRGLIAAYRFYTLDAAAGAAEIEKLKTAR